MRCCDRCGEKTVALILVDKKDGQEWDLCHECQDAFLKFMARTIEVAATESGMVGTTIQEDLIKNEKRGPGRPKKNGAN